MREVVIVAGEASGDLHAAGVARELRHLRPDLALVGIGGHHMEEAGVTLLERAERLAVMGFVEVLRHVPAHWRLLRQLEARLRGGDVALLVLLDYPGFNMKLADAAHRAGVPVLYYITPQVWAWGAKRIPRLARTVTKAAVIFSFEETLLRDAGVDAEFVGHPLLDHVHELPDAAEARRRLGLDPARPVLALFPGSRRQEIARHLEDFVAVARELQQRRPLLQVVVSVAPTVDVEPTRCPFPAVRGESMTVLRAASAALCKSGTTTLQAAVADCPLVVAYRTNPWTYRIARRVVRIPHIGLVNIVAGREVAKEFVQEALLPEQVADALTPLLDEGSAPREAMRRDLAHVRARLGEPGAAARVARLASALASPSAAPGGAARA